MKYPFVLLKRPLLITVYGDRQYYTIISLTPEQEGNNSEIPISYPFTLKSQVDNFESCINCIIRTKGWAGFSALRHQGCLKGINHFWSLGAAVAITIQFNESDTFLFKFNDLLIITTLITSGYQRIIIWPETWQIWDNKNDHFK